MQKQFSLQPDEIRQARQLEDEQRNLLAQYGTLELNRRSIRKRLPQIEEQQRGLVRSVVGRLGISNFNAARIVEGAIQVDVPDEAPALAPPPVDTPVVVERARPNGK